MSDCANLDVRELLPDLLHGSLDAARRGVVEQHVARCADCADELGLLQAVRESAVHTAPAVDVAAVVAALPEPPRARALPQPARSARRVGRSRALPAWIGLAAALGIAAVGSWATGIGGFGSTAASDTLAVVDSGEAGASGREAWAELGSGLSFGGGVADLSDADVIALLDELDELEPAPPAEPDPAWGTLRGVGGS